MEEYHATMRMHEFVGMHMAQVKSAPEIFGELAGYALEMRGRREETINMSTELELPYTLGEMYINHTVDEYAKYKSNHTSEYALGEMVADAFDKVICIYLPRISLNNVVQTPESLLRNMELPMKVGVYAANQRRLNEALTKESRLVMAFMPAAAWTARAISNFRRTLPALETTSTREELPESLPALQLQQGDQQRYPQLNKETSNRLNKSDRVSIKNKFMEFFGQERSNQGQETEHLYAESKKRFTSIYNSMLQSFGDELQRTQSELAKLMFKENEEGKKEEGNEDEGGGDDKQGGGGDNVLARWAACSISTVATTTNTTTTTATTTHTAGGMSSTSPAVLAAVSPTLPPRNKVDEEDGDSELDFDAGDFDGGFLMLEPHTVVCESDGEVLVLSEAMFPYLLHRDNRPLVEYLTRRHAALPADSKIASLVRVDERKRKTKQAVNASEKEDRTRIAAFWPGATKGC
jgi:hypothetical protein